MKTKSLKKIIDQLKKLNLPKDFDLVVGITNGGIVPAYLVASHLKLPLEYIGINFRGPTHQPVGESPKLTKSPGFNYQDKKILLVDDRSNSGKTLDFAKIQLSGAKKIETLVFNGPADYQLFNESCFCFPWDI